MDSLKYQINYKIATLYLLTMILLFGIATALVQPVEAVLPEYSMMAEASSVPEARFILKVADSTGDSVSEYAFVNPDVDRTFADGSAHCKILLPESAMETLGHGSMGMIRAKLVEYSERKWVVIDLEAESQGAVVIKDKEGVSVSPIRLSADTGGLVLQPWRSKTIRTGLPVEQRLVLVNSKNKYMPVKFTLKDMVKAGLKSSHKVLNVNAEIVPSLQGMMAASKKAGFQLSLVSGHRSVDKQTSIFNGKVSALKKAKVKSPETVASRTIQRPGFSEHHTGYAVDILTSKILSTSKFYGTKEAAWLESNAYKYGFIIRYPKGKTAITGISHEPWHLRYVGQPYATWFNTSKSTLEELIEEARDGIVMDTQEGKQLLIVTGSKTKVSYDEDGGYGFVCKKFNISEDLIGIEVLNKRQEKIEKLNQNVTVN